MDSNGYFTEQTMFKVYKSLRKIGLDEDKAIDAMNEMQNEGILFREKRPANNPGPVYRETSS